MDCIRLLCLQGGGDGVPRRISLVKNYSKKVLRPVVIMGDATCKHIASLNHKEEQTAEYIRLSIPEPQPADKNSYRHWARSLRDAIS